MVASPAGTAAACSRPRARIKKTPASRRTRLRCREWLGVFLEEAKPASVMPRSRVGGRFVLPDVEMTRLACFRRKCLLGRNLITLFQCVNSFAKIFLPAPAPGCRHRRIALPRIGARNTHRTARHDRTLLKNAAFNALFPQRLFRSTGIACALDAWKAHPENPRRRINRVIFPAGRIAWIWHRASPNARICANYFAASARSQRPSRSRIADARGCGQATARTVPGSHRVSSSVAGSGVFARSVSRRNRPGGLHDRPIDRIARREERRSGNEGRNPMPAECDPAKQTGRTRRPESGQAEWPTRD